MISADLTLRSWDDCSGDLDVAIFRRLYISTVQRALVATGRTTGFAVHLGPFPAPEKPGIQQRDTGSLPN